MDKPAHMPVLLQEVVGALDVSRVQMIVDATYGRGGHTGAILENLDSHAQLIVIDRDPSAIEHAEQCWSDDHRVEIIHAPFSELGIILAQRDLVGKVDAILFDFGVSSPQLDAAERGFSFSQDGPLDMRMDPEHGLPAAQWISQVEEKDLVNILKEYGEERFARRIARKIKQFSAQEEIASTAQLARLVSGVIPTREKGNKPGTRRNRIRVAPGT
jgi:16S rRNA (cytosine1402-N4)-methyltransferase